MNTTITNTLEETFSYRHKKFDLTKRLDMDASSSSSSEYECLKVKIERLNHSPFSQTSGDDLSNFSWSAMKYGNKKRHSAAFTENSCNNDTHMPPFKKRRILSESDSSYSSTLSLLPNTRLTSPPISTTIIPPTTAILPKISDETLRSICKYHGNMVRKFPKKERTPKDQERRNKNTIACRMSRRVKKLEHIALGEQYKEFSQQTFDIIKQSIRATAYLHELMRLSSSCSKLSIGEKQTMEALAAKKTSSSPQQKKPFTIAFLTGQEDS